jgi:hypothetical protein
MNFSEATHTPAIRALADAEIDAVTGGKISDAQAAALINSMWDTIITVGSLASGSGTGPCGWAVCSY